MNLFLIANDNHNQYNHADTVQHTKILLHNFKETKQNKTKQNKTAKNDKNTNTNTNTNNKDNKIKNTMLRDMNRKKKRPIT